MPDQIIKEIFDILRSENFPVIVGLVSGVLAIGLISVASLPKKLFNLGWPARRKLYEAPMHNMSGAVLSVEDFVRIRRELASDLEMNLTQATEKEKLSLKARISELEHQIANPDAAMADAEVRITDLEARLERMGNDIGGERLVKVRKGLESRDYTTERNA